MEIGAVIERVRRVADYVLAGMDFGICYERLAEAAMQIRAGASNREMAAALGVNIRLLYTIGGDGTFRGALAIHEEIQRRGVKIAVVGVPKTIDNDILLVDRTFGFFTAVSLASETIQAAYNEAASVAGGVGLVKLMGRHSGFIAARWYRFLADHKVTVWYSAPTAIRSLMREGDDTSAAYVVMPMRL